ncbi:MAG: asparagine synthase (glutamine-hydrolyzing) [Deltaproteobacteria bacterium]|nr:asparagine synthase (glutamine-hydrolyzing) [Deltaproteobacteria bacterium]
MVGQPCLMCGIAGLIDLSGAPAASSTIERMLQTIVHRGPDDGGVFVDGPVGLGHRRLAILDLSVAAHQPMQSHDGALTLVYNGEIYNHQELKDELRAAGREFRSDSDTEVVLQAYATWGADCVRRFNGMWALALWDRRQNRLWLSRDRFGVKPLQYLFLPGKVCAFASEAKAILAAVPGQNRLDLQSAAELVQLGGLGWSARTFFADIVQLPAAHHLWVERDGRRRLERYWDPDAIAAGTSGDPDPAATFREMFVDAVRLRLRADVEVGTCLSGGLDSSAIVSVATKVLGVRSLQAFSSLHAEREANEERYIRAVAADTGAVLHTVRPQPAELFRRLEEIVWHQETPAPTASLFSQWEVMRTAHGKVKVLLDGQGADELLGGYTGYFPTYLTATLRELRAHPEPRRALALVASLPALRIISGQPLVLPLVARRLPGSARALLQALARAVGRKAPPEPMLGGAVFKGAAAPQAHWPQIPEVTGDPLRDLLRHQLFAVGLPTLLQLEDRSSMAFSIEARLPFTDDHRLVEYCLGLPRTWLIRGYSTKHVLREAMRGLLLEKVRRRRLKLGFPTPLSAWLRREPRLLDVWERTDFDARGLIAGDRVKELVAEHRRGTADRSAPLFRALTMEAWCRVFIDQGGRKPEPGGAP